jgi:RNA polymerase sigma-70 factor (ECF subfamily)
MKSDEELMLDYKRGNEESFRVLYEKYSPLVYGFIKRRLRESEVDDLYQKVWRQLHEKRELFWDQPFAPWFFVMIKNLLVDEYRSLARRSAPPPDELVEELCLRLSEKMDIEDLLQRLPEESRNLVRKYYLEGVSYEELEQESGLSQTNLRQRLSRALRGLRSYREE